MKSFVFLLGIFIFTISSIEIVTSTETEAKVPESEHETQSHSVILDWLFGRSESEKENPKGNGGEHTKEVPPLKNNNNNRTARQLLLSPQQALLIQQQQQQQQQIAAAAINQALINRNLQNSYIDDSSEEDDDFDSDEFWDQSPLRKGNLGLLGTGGVRLYRSEEVVDEADARQGELNVTTTVSPIPITSGNVTTTVSPITSGNLTTVSPTPAANLTTTSISNGTGTGNLTTSSVNLTTLPPTPTTGNLTVGNSTNGNLTTSSPLNFTMASNLTTPTPAVGNLTTVSMMMFGNLTTPLSNISTTVSPVTDPSTVATTPDSGKKPPYKDSLNCRCGMQEVRNENVGYASQEVNTYPWMVSIDSKSSHLCAGSIINSKFIITAASCVKKYEAKDLEIEAGLLSMNKTKFTVKKVHIHPEYEESSQANNLALLQVEETIRTSSSIKFVCLPISGKPEIGAGTLVTWLESKGKAKGQLTLVQAQVQEVKEKRCKELLSNSTGGKLTPGSFCSAPPPRNECGSDVGGGFLTHGKGYSFSLTGVISWTAGCKKDGVPAIHTYVQQYVRWILFKSQAGEFCKSPTFTHKEFSFLPE